MRLRRHDAKGKQEGPLDSILHHFVSGETTTIHMLRLLVAQKLEDLGTTLSPNQVDRLVENLVDLMARPTGRGIETISIEDETQDDLHLDISFSPDDLQRFEQTFTEAVEQRAGIAIEALVTATTNAIEEQADDAISNRAKESEDFQRRLLARWAKPLRLFSMLIGLAQQFGSDRNNWLRTKATAADRATIEALTRLHARACQVASEIEHLLKGGFADGALSRWRTLHELVVVAYFIQAKGSEVAERYLDHLEIDSLRLAEQYNKAFDKLGYEKISNDEMAKLLSNADRLAKKYGKEFKGGHGWASGFVHRSRTEPNFLDIEEAVQFEALRPYYKLASATVHAGPKGAFWKLGEISTSSCEVLLAGPSNAGLSEAGRLAAMSLAQISVPLMLVHTSVDAVVWARVLKNLADDTGESFVEVDRKLEDQEVGGWHRRVKVPDRLRKVPGPWPKRIRAQITGLVKTTTRVSAGIAAVETLPKRRSRPR